jgi:hypothetical protein
MRIDKSQSLDFPRFDQFEIWCSKCISTGYAHTNIRIPDMRYCWVRSLILDHGHWTRSTPVYRRAADDTAGPDDVTPEEPHPQIVISGSSSLETVPFPWRIFCESTRNDWPCYCLILFYFPDPAKCCFQTFTMWARPPKRFYGYLFLVTRPPP